MLLTNYKTRIEPDRLAYIDQGQPIWERYLIEDRSVAVILLKCATARVTKPRVPHGSPDVGVDSVSDIL